MVTKKDPRQRIALGIQVQLEKITKAQNLIDKAKSEIESLRLQIYP